MALINKSNVKEHAILEERPLNVSNDFLEALEEKADRLIKDACKRARLNSRNTVMARDL